MRAWRRPSVYCVSSISQPTNNRGKTIWLKLWKDQRPSLREKEKERTVVGICIGGDSDGTKACKKQQAETRPTNLRHCDLWGRREVIPVEAWVEVAEIASEESQLITRRSPPFLPSRTPKQLTEHRLQHNNYWNNFTPDHHHHHSSHLCLQANPCPLQPLALSTAPFVLPFLPRMPEIRKYRPWGRHPPYLRDFWSLGQLW